ncbi:CDGSH iron-sulfur domain-containing protein [uncultured Bacteroides sp.]|uniref:CDGSH iron-sulfur domain-containing protein n=1 Tax=uncultured Bacteroides sp. TaxID=162156 RepID=UPI0025EDDA08|nr:CDGSH iron-sulfur domain-containing protein [uncultured Bacteroides sp.]
MEKEENKVAVTATPNGPFIVEGNFKLIDREGRATMKEGRIALCRCGRSSKQPFCDGTHRKIHYNDLSVKHDSSI